MVNQPSGKKSNQTTLHVTATAPSNIALVKYWGKSDASLNWPANDSLSMTLSQAKTTTSATMQPDAATPSAHRMAFKTTGAGTIPVRDLGKTTRYLEWLRNEIRPFGSAEGALDILTHNSFPSSCGIASSASGFAALTIAAAGAWTGAKNMDELRRLGITRDVLSTWARRGSGSACRSIHGGYVQWIRGEASSGQKVRPIFSPEHWPLADLIVVIDRGAKSISSTEGHARAFSSPLMSVRMSGLDERLKNAAQAIEGRDLERLGTIIECEAIEMHSVMMTSQPRTDYFGAPTIAFIQWLRESRAAGNLAAWFTLDAGPNPHVICRPEDADAIKGLILAQFPGCALIHDQTGSGATLGPGQETHNANQGGSDGH